MMLKKVMCFALGVGIGVGISYAYNNQYGVEQKIKCVKRKLKKVERQIENTLDSLSPEQMQKYKSELETKLKEIKSKIDNLTIKDIKDSAEGAINTIKQNITNLSHKVSSLMNNSNN